MLRKLAQTLPGGYAAVIALLCGPASLDLDQLDAALANVAETWRVPSAAARFVQHAVMDLTDDALDYAGKYRLLRYVCVLPLTHLPMQPPHCHNLPRCLTAVLLLQLNTCQRP